MNTKHFVIYKTTNLINGKIYVGKDEYDNPKYFGSGKLLHQAIKKYGIENFKKEIIDTCKTPKQHCEKEVFWINELDCFSPKGYNILNGSFGGDAYTHHPNKKSYSLHLSNSLRGKTFTQLHKDRIAEQKIGNLNPAKQQNSRDKISENRKNKLVGSDNPMSNSHRTRSSKPSVKGDRFEYLRNKIKCTDILTGEITMCDGLKEVIEKFKISKNKYYVHLKTKEPINKRYVFNVL